MLTGTGYTDLLNTERFNNLFYNLSISVDEDCIDNSEWQNFVNYMRNTVTSHCLSNTSTTLPEDAVNNFWYSSEFDEGITQENVEHIVLLADKAKAYLPKDKFRTSIVWYHHLESR